MEGRSEALPDSASAPQWWRGHGQAGPPEPALPPVGSHAPVLSASPCPSISCTPRAPGEDGQDRRHVGKEKLSVRAFLYRQRPSGLPAWSPGTHPSRLTQAAVGMGVESDLGVLSQGWGSGGRTVSPGTAERCCMRLVRCFLVHVHAVLLSGASFKALPGRPALPSVVRTRWPRDAQRPWAPPGSRGACGVPVLVTSRPWAPGAALSCAHPTCRASRIRVGALRQHLGRSPSPKRGRAPCLPVSHAVGRQRVSDM